jgi:XTP/dITP diphosphohydrolase
MAPTAKSSHKYDLPVRTICVPRTLPGDDDAAAVILSGWSPRNYTDKASVVHYSDVKPRKWSAIVVATTNTGKLREIHDALTGLPVTLRSLNDFPGIPEPEETGHTFAANAALKARAYAAATGLPAVADDSGLAIDALDGRPGVWSARYPGDTYDEKFANLFQELAPCPRPWTARFICAVALAHPVEGAEPAVLFEGSGEVEGTITDTPRGTNGFGYDPIFFYPPYGGTLAEIDSARKLAVSHRGAAMRQFRRWLETQEG